MDKSITNVGETKQYRVNKLQLVPMFKNIRITGEYHMPVSWCKKSSKILPNFDNLKT